MTPPLVFLHGMLGAASSWDELRALVPDRACHAPTLFGHGGDARPVPADLPAAADGLVAQLDAELGHRPVDLVGYSFGARLALQVCVRHPQRFRRAVLISGHPGLDDAAARAARRVEDDAWAERAERGGIDAFVAAWEARPIFATQRALDADRQIGQRAIRRMHDAQAIGQVLRRLGLGRMSPLRPALPAIAARLTWVVGAEDPPFVALAETLRVALPAIAVAQLDHVGHNPVLESPTRVAALLRAYLPARAHTPIDKEQRP